MIEHDAWSLDLPLNFRSIVPLPTPGDYALLYLDESDISMLTADGSSGASTYQLTPVFDDPAGVPTACSWSSSNPSAVEVDHTGLCTCVGAGAATITATKDAVSKTCSVTGFATMPSVASLYALKGGSAAGTADISPFFVMTSQNDGDANNDSCIVAMEHRPSGAGVYSGLIRTSGCGVINPSLFDGDDWKPYYNLNNGSGTEFVYKLAGYTQVADTLIKETHHYNGSQYSVNGSAYTATLTGSNAAPLDGSIQINFLNNIKKYVMLGWGASGLTKGQMEARLLCKYSWVPQDYIRYTDISGRTNYTKIPNRGTLGNTYDLAADNVPEGWFAV
jgi:hypothetical protein